MQKTDSELKKQRDAHRFWNSNQYENVRDMAHWCGNGRFADERQWLRFGELLYSLYAKAFPLLGVKPPEVMLEWGCGGGTNVLAFSQHVKRLYGVDISRATLAECARQAKNRGAENFIPVPIRATSPQGALRLVPEKLDFFLSAYVFQHFPGKKYAEKVLGIAHRLLKDDGTALIQIRFDGGEGNYVSQAADYLQNVTAFTSFTLEEFSGLCAAAGFSVVYVLKIEQIGNYAYFFLKKTG